MRGWLGFELAIFGGLTGTFSYYLRATAGPKNPSRDAQPPLRQSDDCSVTIVRLCTDTA